MQIKIERVFKKSVALMLLHAYRHGLRPSPLLNAPERHMDNNLCSDYRVWLIIHIHLPNNEWKSLTGFSPRNRVSVFQYFQMFSNNSEHDAKKVHLYQYRIHLPNISYNSISWYPCLFIWELQSKLEVEM